MVLAGTAFHSELTCGPELQLQERRKSQPLQQSLLHQKNKSTRRQHCSSSEAQHRKASNLPHHPLLHVSPHPPFPPLPKKILGFFNDAIYSMIVPPLTSPRQRRKSHSTTKVQTLRLNSSVLAKCLAACKKHNATFASLLATLINVTLATDIYPSSKFRILATQVRLSTVCKARR